MTQKTIQDKLDKSFAKYKNRIAIKYGDTGVSYGDLKNKSNAIADILLGEKLRKRVHIGILLENRIDLISTIVGVLKTGCAFIPLDSECPDKRLAKMISLSGARFIIADKKNAVRLEKIKRNEGVEIQIAILDEDLDQSKESVERRKISYSPNDKIYIYFSSGSTSFPKPVIGKNSSLAHFVDWEIKMFNINERFKISQLSPYSFGVFLRDVFTPLSAGATICAPLGKDLILKPGGLAEWVEENKINLIHCTPGMFNLFYSAKLGKEYFKHLKYVYLGGDKLNPRDLTKWYSVFGNRIKLFNTYGQIETAMTKLYYQIKPSDVEKNNIPVGKPIIGAKVAIINNGRVCRKGESGEICVRTAYGNLGYYKNKKLNKEKFLKDFSNGKPGNVLYKTGDLGAINKGGDVEHLGRIDHSIKLRGRSVNLNEIETLVKRYPFIEECVVTNKKIGKDERLVTYYSCRRTIRDFELRNYLLEYLPVFMAPVHFIKLDKIPRTVSGKIDYGLLPDPGKEKKELRNKIRGMEKKGDLEATIRNIWKEVLGVDEIKKNDNFFNLGGHSLKAIQLIARIDRELNRKISFEEIINNSEFKKQVRLLSKKHG